MELHLKYRPKTLEQIVGQTAAVAQLRGYLANAGLPHALLFVGPSGTGKTTAARCLQKELQCSDMDLQEENCGGWESPLDKVRDIQRHCRLAPGGKGKSRIYILDEIQTLSRAPGAQEAMLKTLEEPPRHVYFMLATTEPERIKKTVRNRCAVVRMVPVGNEHIKNVVQNVATAEKKPVSKLVAENIASVVEGSVRAALVLLEKVINLKKERQQLAAIERADLDPEVKKLAQALMTAPRWPEVSQLLKELEGEDAENIRYRLLGYYRIVLLANQKLAPRCSVLIDMFYDNFYDSKYSGLCNVCYKICHAR